MTENEAESICGAVHNGMSPIGLTDMRVPVIVDEEVTKQKTVFVGGLDPLVKARISVQDLLQSFHAIVAPITGELDASSKK